LAVWLTKLKLDCRACSDPEKIERGCEKDSPIQGAWKLGDWEFERCPLKIVTRESLDYVRAYIFFQNGYLPHAGGWTDQSAKFIDAVEIIENEISKIREEAEKNAH